MIEKKLAKIKLLAIIGSASENSSNHTIVNFLKSNFPNLEISVFDTLKSLPHFDPLFTDKNIPNTITSIRNKINESDAILISTPEYIFSIPSGLKNLFEWCVSTTIFSNKPAFAITASASGEKAQEELLLILRTLGANITDEFSILIKGIKGQFKEDGTLNASTSNKLLHSFEKFYTTLNP